jgi:hypothetical protein
MPGMKKPGTSVEDARTNPNWCPCRGITDEVIFSRRLDSHSLPDVDDRGGPPPSRPVGLGR